jgi:hypothetical protein
MTGPTIPLELLAGSIIHYTVSDENVVKRLREVTSTDPISGDSFDSQEKSSRGHGLTAWVRRQKKPGEDPTALHLEEQLELDLARFYRLTKGNTGPSAAVASHIRVFETYPPKHCNWYPNGEDHPVAFLVNGFLDKHGRPFADPGPFHFRMLRIAKTGLPQKAASDFPTTEEDLFAIGGFRVFKIGRGRNKTSDRRWREDEAWKAERAKYEAILEAGRGWSPLNPPEDTRFLPSGVKYNLSNPVVKQILYEIDKHRLNFDSRKKLAAELGLKYETVRKKELEDINMKKEQPNTPFTAEQMKDFNARDGRVVYVHVEGLDRPRWFKLDMDRHETYRKAIDEIRWKSQDEAFKKAKVPSRRTDKRTFQDHPTLARAFKEVVVRYELAFRPENLYILDLRSPMVVAIAEEAWNENGVPNTTFAP